MYSAIVIAHSCRVYVVFIFLHSLNHVVMFFFFGKQQQQQFLHLPSTYNRGGGYFLDVTDS